VDVVVEGIIRGRKTVHNFGKKILKGPTKELGANTNDTLMMPALVP
jgi:hypothetical protein